MSGGSNAVLLRRGLLILSGLAGAGGVALAALAAHRLEGQAQSWAQTAVQMQLIHAAVLLALALAGPLDRRLVQAAAGALAGGMLLFCGSLTLLAFGVLGHAPLAPAGGSLMMGGWLLLAVQGLRRG